MSRIIGFLMILTIFFAGALLGHAETPPSPAWVTQYNGPANGNDVPKGVAADNNGNVYVTGYSPGTGTGNDYLTIKYDSNGNQLWAVRYNGSGSGNDYAYDIAVDSAGNAYVTGQSYLTSSLTDYLTIKYDTNGNQLWVARYNSSLGSYNDSARAIALDSSGNAYVTGRSKGTTTGDDYITIKYNGTNGNQLWAARYAGPAGGDDRAQDIAVDSSGDVCVTGWSTGVFNGYSSYDYATVKYNTNGIQLWAARYNYPYNRNDNNDFAYAIAVDGSGNVYVTGGSQNNGTNTDDYATIKYDVNGNQVWLVRYANPTGERDIAYDMVLDSNGDVYVTGWSYEIGGPGFITTTIKYDSINGSQLWLDKFDGDSSSNNEDFYNIGLDGNNDIYVATASYLSSSDIALIKYSSSGAQLWNVTYNSPDDKSELPTAMAVDGTGNVHIAGYKATGTTSDDYLVIKYGTTSAVGNNPPVLDPIGDKTIAEGQTLSFTISATDPDGDTLTYSASNLPSGASFNSSTRAFSWTPDYTQAGTYTGIHFEVSDGQLTDSEDITITVTNANQPPNTSSIPSPANGATGIGINTTLSWTGGDPDTGDTVVYDVYAGTSPSSLSLLSSNQSSTSYTSGTLDYSTTYYWKIVARDSSGAETEGPVWSFTTTTATNQPPVLNPIGNKTVNEGQALSFTISATDPDNDPLTYSAANLPSGAGFNPSTRTFSWTPNYSQAGTYTGAHFEVTDGTASDSEDITITVNPPGEGMTLLEIALNVTNNLISTYSSSSMLVSSDIKGKAVPTDFLRKAATSFREAISALDTNALETVYIRIGKAIWDLKKTCSANIPAGNVIRVVVESPTVLECTSDGVITSDGIKNALLETAYNNTAALISSPDPLWGAAALNALKSAAWNMEIATYRLAQGRLDESFVYLGRAMRYYQNASAYGVPSNTTVQLITEKYTTTYYCSVYSCY